MIYIICLIVGYLFGSIPCGYLYAKANRVNIFDVGSKSPGSTNVGRVLGRKAGLTVFALDLVKTFTALIIMHLLLKFGVLNVFIPEMMIEDIKNVSLSLISKRTLVEAVVIHYTGLGVILGHNYPFTTKFRGGKGITCTLGVIFYFSWYLAIILYLVHKLIKKTTHYVSVASISAVSFVFIVSLILVVFHIPPYDFNNAFYVLPATFLMSLLGVYTHRTNITRLINGKENKC